MTLNYGKCSIWPRHLGKTNGIHFELILVRCFFWQTEAVLDKDFIKNTPIWLNPTVSGLSNRQWFKGTSTIADFLGTMNVILPMEEFRAKHHVKTNFLDYNYITTKI